MNDAISGLLVAAATAAVVAGIFLWSARAKKGRIEALRSLCAQRGWNYAGAGGPLRHGHAIAGEGWVFEAVSRSSGREAAPGSSEWGHSTQWRVTGEDPGRSTFILGPRLGGLADFSRLPPQLLSRFLGDEVAGLQPTDPGERLADRYVLFAPANARPRDIFPGRAVELLLAWPVKLPLIVRSSPARFQVQVLNKRLEKPEEVARLVELGESLLER